MYIYIYACICVRVCIYIQTIKERPSTVIQLACGNFFHLQVEWRATVVMFLNPAENQVSCSQEWESRRDYTCPRTATYQQYIYICIYIYTCIYILPLSFSHTHTDTHTYTHTDTHTHTHTHTHT